MVHISEVAAGRQADCVCPECGEQLIARKGPKLAHHFAHEGGTECSGESALHKLGKLLIHAGIQRALAARTPVQLHWKCHQCPDSHEGNLLKKAASVKLEHNLDEARPDVLLLNDSGQPVVAIEVVVTHAPEDTVLEYYARRSIQLVRVNLTDGAALEPLMDLQKLSASFVSFCARRKCPRCRKPMTKRTLHIIQSDCHRCEKPMKVALLAFEGQISGPEAFRESDLKLAREHGCIIEKRHSHTMDSSYMASVCPRCRAFVGQHFLHHHWGSPTEAVVEVGHWCF